ncbi:AAA family ATPase [Metabacillus arenae]|uniref:AAA family ATPase n=1 Tax=Metabacillus arenae TaxID=2771434 RepID=A0A926S0T3_9BACI|nr:AAA family ATPase [Metabacillus arenae]MBD1383627.1 AAA family ATPase [Metabacillus arenae]
MFLKNVTILRDQIPSFKQYPFSIPVIFKLKKLSFKQSVTFFVGENGSGKSTLIEAIAAQIGFNKAGGSTQNRFEEEHTVSTLHNYLRLSWLPKVTNGFFLRAETFYQFASYLDQLQRENPDDIFASYGGISLHEQSHGESFLSLFKNRFGKKGIYLLDEPEAALSPARQLALLKIIHDLEKEGQSQFIIATHSPILLGYPNAEIFNFDDGEIKKINYEDTDHYQITKYFLENREGLLHHLFREEEEEGGVN